MVRRVVLAVEVLRAWVRVRRLLRHAALPDTVARLRTPDPRARFFANAPPELLARAVQRTLPLLPADTRCLTRSLVLTRLLASRGQASHLVIGVSADPEEPFGAHAWVEHQGRALLPEGGEQFGRLVEL